MHQGRFSDACGFARALPGVEVGRPALARPGQCPELRSCPGRVIVFESLKAIPANRQGQSLRRAAPVPDGAAVDLDFGPGLHQPSKQLVEVILPGPIGRQDPGLRSECGQLAQR